MATEGLKKLLKITFTLPIIIAETLAEITLIMTLSRECGEGDC